MGVGYALYSTASPAQPCGYDLLVADLDVILAPVLAPGDLIGLEAPLSRRDRHAPDSTGTARLGVAGPLHLDRSLSFVWRTARARRNQRETAADRWSGRRRRPGMARSRAHFPAGRRRVGSEPFRSRDRAGSRRPARTETGSLPATSIHASSQRAE